ncbi:DoxX family protein [Burkholderia sp. Bp9142]|uniref:DoxX family protein n=1 Tax=Burkholderia sp. Bp9142 TaxID=2184573 RepID=UPI000F59FD44|nr:DoxX family protein [Burkholderia sp. Bp9142]RQR30145.1 DoxX family membrane protein [Burkholderia sp. Bp9142]
MNVHQARRASSPRRTTRFVSWSLRILAASAFLAAGGAKLAGVPMMVAIFDHIGIGQWFRFVTGVTEIVGGVAILIPVSALFGALLLSTTMAVAVLVHLFVIGGSPAPAIALLLVTATVAWLHRPGVTAGR